MLNRTKRIQLRSCAICGKNGHNKSTCPEYLATLKPASVPRSVNFFVHHVTHEPAPSPHVINLKHEEYQKWTESETVAPEPSRTSLYHYYHKLRPEPIGPKSTSLFAKPLNSDRQFSIPVTTDKIKTAEPIKNNIQTEPKPPKQKKYYWRSFENTINKYAEKLGSSIVEFFRQINSVIKKTGQSLFRRGAWVIALLIIAVALPGPAFSYYQSIRSTTTIITENSTAGFASLQKSTTALMSADLITAQTSINDALFQFESAISTMEKNHQYLQTVIGAIPIVGKEVTGRQNLIIAGQKIALGNTYLLKGLTDNNTGNTSTPITAQIKTIIPYLKASIPNYEQALENLQGVDIDSLPYEYRSNFTDFKSIFSSILNDLKNLTDLGNTIQDIFGGQGLRRYLLVFQNEDEIRPTGGFIGSLAIMEIKDGAIKKLDILPGGSYDLQGQLSEFIIPPAPLTLSNKRWEFQDANWFPDFPTSAEKLLWFYQHSRDITADGVIAINSSVLERLLSITGPITDEARGLTISSDDAIHKIQNIVETGPEKSKNKPKQVLADLAPKFFTYFQNTEPQNLFPLLINLQEALERKEIQAYFIDYNTENSIQEYGWGGQMIQNILGQDYLMVVNTNIAGQKTDAKIRQNISHQAVVQDDGSVIDTVIITRTHEGQNEGGLYGSPNVDYIRLYVPEGSELISASGFSWPEEKRFRVPEDWYKKDLTLSSIEKEIKIDNRTGTRITNEFSKTAFANWVITEPGQTSQIEFTYRLPHKLFSGESKNATRYQLILQRQSGNATDFESQIIFPENWQPVWRNGDNTTLAKNGMIIGSQTIHTDMIWSIAVKQ
ncbi:MAG: DUF4012 domain-containing protein [bacterium]|nr:DUF4012 domain-containing protein [bacterium]